MPRAVKAQTRQAVARLEAALDATGLGLEDVVESTVFLTDIRHFGAYERDLSRARARAASGAPTVGTALMSPDALVEIMMIADAKK